MSILITLWEGSFPSDKVVCFSSIYIQYINVCGLISASIEQSGNKYYMYMNNSGAHDIVGLACDSLVTSWPWTMEILTLCSLPVKKNVYNRIHHSRAEGLLLVAYYDAFVSPHKILFLF